MGSINSVVMCGHIANKDKMEVRESKNGKKYLRFSLCVNRYANNVSTPNYFNWLAWGRNAESIYEHFSDGGKIALVGEAVQSKPFEKQDGTKTHSSTEFWVTHWDFAGRNSAKKSSSKNNDSGFVEVPEGISEDLPFA